MQNKTVGYIIIGISIAIAFIILSFNQALTKIVDTSCPHGPSCPMYGTIGFQTSVSMGLNAFIALIGLYLIFFAKEDIIIRKIIKPQMKIEKPTKRNFSEIIKTLTKEEKDVFEKLFEKEYVYQSDLARKTGFSKVKTTRILDRLEARNLIERKRRGMANIVVLKK